MSEYDDILHLPHHQAEGRVHMSLHDRSAQFAPFAALVGYEEMVEEEARLTDRRIELTEYDLEVLNRKLLILHEALKDGAHPEITLIYFQPDKFKFGGRYFQITAKIKRIDPVAKEIVLFGSDDIEDRTINPVIIPIEDLFSVSGKAVDELTG